VARYSGDEFVLVLPDMAHDQDICAIAEKVIERISEPYGLNDQLIRIGISIGIALCPNRLRMRLPCCATPTWRCTRPR